MHPINKYKESHYLSSLTISKCFPNQLPRSWCRGEFFCCWPLKLEPEHNIIPTPMNIFMARKGESAHSMEVREAERLSAIRMYHIDHLGVSEWTSLLWAENPHYRTGKQLTGKAKATLIEITDTVEQKHPRNRINKNYFKQNILNYNKKSDLCPKTFHEFRSTPLAQASSKILISKMVLNVMIALAF